MRVLLELRKQLTPRSIEVLRQHVDVARYHATTQTVGHISQLLMRRKEHQRPAIDRLGDIANHGGNLVEERWVVEIMKVGRQAEQRLRQVIEG